MHVKIISLGFNSVYGDFSDTVVREFLKDKEVSSIEDHFFIRNDIPYLTLVIYYFPIRQEIDSKIILPEKRDERWKEILSDSDLGLFNILRNWRSQRCKKEGLPPYVLFTNQQLAQIVKARPQSLSELNQIQGFGKSKLDKYGDEILAITKLSLEAHEKNTQLVAEKGEENVYSKDTSSSGEP